MGVGWRKGTSMAVQGHQWKAALAAVTACLAAAGAWAQAGDGAAPGDAPETAAIEGDWSFETAVYDTSCQMTGSLSIAPTGVDGIYEGELRTLERCDWYDRHFGETFPGYRSRQSVRLSRRGADVVIHSELIEVEPNLGNYLPDNFVLEVRHSALMEGQLRSADIAPVKFFRDNAAIS